MPVLVRAGAHPVWHQELLPQLAQEVTHLTPRQSQGWDRAAPPGTMWCPKIGENTHQRPSPAQTQERSIPHPPLLVGM